MSKVKELTIFVYGSLKQGHSNSSRIIDMGGSYLEEVETVEGFKLYLYSPYENHKIATMVRSFKGKVKGQLVLIPNIEIINKFEGHPHYYRLEPIAVKNNNGEIIKTFSYLFQHPYELIQPVAKLIKSGIYIEE